MGNQARHWRHVEIEPEAMRCADCDQLANRVQRVCLCPGSLGNGGPTGVNTDQHARSARRSGRASPLGRQSLQPLKGDQADETQDLAACVAKLVHFATRHQDHRTCRDGIFPSSA